MSYEYNQQELEACLAQCMEDCKLREILAKEGIPESEPVTLSIKSVDNDMDVITNHSIPTTSPQPPVAPTEIDFDQEIKDFLDQAETDHGLLSALPRSEPLPDGTIKTTFNLTFDIGEPFRFKKQVLAFICGEPPRICQ